MCCQNFPGRFITRYTHAKHETILFHKCLGAGSRQYTADIPSPPGLMPTSGTPTFTTIFCCVTHLKPGSFTRKRCQTPGAVIFRGSFRRLTEITGIRTLVGQQAIFDSNPGRLPCLPTSTNITQCKKTKTALLRGRINPKP